MKQITELFLSFFSQYDTYIIAGHKEPDGDCIGSCLALDSWLKRKGKKTILLSSGPFKRPEIKEYEPLFVSSISDTSNLVKTGLIVVDCSGIDRIGDAIKGLENLPIAIIDHHATNDTNFNFTFIDATAPSTTILVQSLIEKSGDTPNLREAEFLLFGLCTDTGFFRHLDSNSAETFAATARLIHAGANPKQVFAQISGGKSWGSRILISRILSRMTRHYEGRLVISWETIEDTQEFGLEGRDSDILYQLIQSISGVEAIVIVRQESPERCTVGFRSKNKIDVSQIAAYFGGGGHKQASGLSIEGTISNLIPDFIQAFEAQFLLLDNQK